MSYKPTPEQQILSNKKQMQRLSWKVSENLSIADSIQEFFEDNDIDLVRFRKRSDNMDIIDKCRVEVDKIERDFGELGRAYYTLKGGNKSVVAAFTNNGALQPMLMAHWYTKHKLCAVWNMRKSQIIRRSYRNYLAEAVVKDKNGIPVYNEQGETRLLIRTFQPVHMVLTLRHAKGVYDGQRFYARKLLEFFREVRRCQYWKNTVYAGEYGLEIKRGKDSNGLHIHMHSLLFLQPGIKIMAFKEWLRDKWEHLTGSTMVHAETLYYYAKDEKGKWITELYRPRKKEAGQWVYSDAGFEIEEDHTGAKWARPAYKVRRKKHYINPAKSTVDEYMKGVMECIKYHFKSDGFKTNGRWDIGLIMEVLNNSRNLRFYSRFGAFYKEPQLNFDFKGEQLQEESVITDEAGDDDVGFASTDGVEERLINPFTMEKARRQDYTICIVRPHLLEYKKTSRGDPDLYRYNLDDFQMIAEGFDLKEIVQRLCTGRIHEVLLFNHKKLYQ